tara:strand:+ start:10 stop:633 length:624 start_codon:yes stop_codon:yes gene_type:complete
MKNKSIIQFALLTLLFFVSFLTFNFYLKKNIGPKDQSNNFENQAKDANLNYKGNIIEDIKYISSNKRGDTYEIFADFSEASIDDPDLMFLKNVKAHITLKNNDKIYLISDFANFNSKTFETTFINNVKITRKNEVITGNELYLVLDQDDNTNLKKKDNLLRMSYNISVQRPGSTLKADVIEIDLITKNLKIFMLNEIKKVTGKTKIN